MLIDQVPGFQVPLTGCRTQVSVLGGQRMVPCWQRAGHLDFLEIGIHVLVLLPRHHDVYFDAVCQPLARQDLERLLGQLQRIRAFAGLPHRYRHARLYLCRFRIRKVALLAQDHSEGPRPGVCHF